MKIRITESQLSRIISEERETVNEQLLPIIGAITLFRQTAFSKTNRLIRHLKKELKREGLDSKDFTEGNVRKFVLCIGEYSKEIEGKFSGREGIKNLAKRKTSGVIKDPEQHKKAYDDFSRGLDERIIKCLNEMGFTGDIMGVRDGIKKVVLRKVFK
jgi:hypothetical protein